MNYVLNRIKYTQWTKFGSLGTYLHQPWRTIDLEKLSINFPQIFHPIVQHSEADDPNGFFLDWLRWEIDVVTETR